MSVPKRICGAARSVHAMLRHASNDPPRLPVCARFVYFAAGRQASLVAASGGPPAADDGSDAVAVVLTDPASGATTRLERNEQGTFYRVFQPNKWRLRKQAEAEAAARQQQAAVEAAAPAAVLVGGSARQ